MIGFWIIACTVLVLISLVGWVVWMNWYDRRTENTLGRHFDFYADKPEYNEKKRRFRDPEEDD